MIYIVLVLGVAMLLLLLLPTLAPARLTPEDTRRTELQEERGQLLSNLRELEATDAGTGLLTREKVRLIQVLQELDNLPPAPGQRQQKPALPLALALVLGVGGVTLLGLYTAFPQWRYSGLPVAEANQLKNLARLPALRAKAEKSGAAADYGALGDAEWDARKYQDAAKAYTQVLLTNRADAKALRRVGFFLLRDKAMAQNGLVFIQRSAQTDPQNPEGQLLYGFALGEFGQYADGLKVLKNYQALAPNSHEADDLIVQFQAQTGAAVDGQLVFAQNCAACHGAAGEGGRGPKLIGSAALQNNLALRQMILHGANGMPAYPQLEGKQLDALVGYLGGLR